MSLKHAILGFLSYKPLSGYDLKNAFDNSVQHFWPADQGQIYRTLNQLEKADLVTYELIPQDGKPSRKEYVITELGKIELHSWLTTPLSPPPDREPFLIQIFFGGFISDEEILTIVANEKEETNQKIAILSGILANYDAAPPEGLDRHLFQSLLTLEAGLYLGRAYLQWLDSMTARIESQDRSINKDILNEGN